MFGAIFAIAAGRMGDTIVPALIEHHEVLPRERWVDCVCVLDDTLVYHFCMDPKGRGLIDWVPAVLCEDSHLGYYESGEDTLLLFCLFLLYQLNAKELFPPDLIRYVSGLRLTGPRIHYRGPVFPFGAPGGGE